MNLNEKHLWRKNSIFNYSSNWRLNRRRQSSLCTLITLFIQLFSCSSLLSRSAPYPSIMWILTNSRISMLHQIRTLKYCICITLLFVFSFVFITHSSLRDINRWNFTVNDHPTTIYPYIAVIVDDRATIQLVTAVLNVLQHIPSDWKVQIFTLDEHWPFYQRSSLASFIRSNRIFMTPIDFPRNNRSGDDFINLCLTSPSLWRRVQGEKVLLFQIDSAICSNSSYKLTDFLHYDFIGAPWKEGGCCKRWFFYSNSIKNTSFARKWIRPISITPTTWRWLVHK